MFRRFGFGLSPPPLVRDSIPNSGVFKLIFVGFYIYKKKIWHIIGTENRDQKNMEQRNSTFKL